MNGTPIIAISVVAVILSAVAVTSAVVLKPTPTIGAGAVGNNELANNSVTGGKIASGTITNTNIANNAVGSGQIADNSITMSDLSSDVTTVITGVENIADNSITSAKIVDGTITDSDIASGAAINPSKISGTAWTSANDGSGSGLDADTVDGLQGTQFLRNDTSGTISGSLVVNGSITHQTETRYYTIPSFAFVGESDSTPYSYSFLVLKNTDGAFASNSYYAPVNLPDGARITNVAVYYYKPDAAATAYVFLQKLGTVNATVATITLTTNAAFSILPQAVTENVVSQNNSYWVSAQLDPNDSAWDIQLAWVCITYTVTKPLP